MYSRIHRGAPVSREEFSARQHAATEHRRLERQRLGSLVCSRHRPPGRQGDLVGMPPSDFDAYDVLNVCKICMGKQGRHLDASPFCIYCTLEELKHDSKRSYRETVISGLFGMVSNLSRPPHPIVSPEASRQCGVQWCTMWSSIFSKVVLAGKHTELYYNYMRAALLSGKYCERTFVALLGPRIHHASRARLSDVLPISVQTVGLLRIALTFQRSLQPIGMQAVREDLREKWLGMACPCRALKSAHQRQRQRAPTPAPRLPHDHPIGKCPYRWSPYAGDSGDAKEKLLRDHALANTGSPLFSNNPNLCILIETANADPFRDLERALSAVVKLRFRWSSSDGKFVPGKKGASSLRNIVLRFLAIFTTLALECASGVPPDFPSRISKFEAFKTAHDTIYDSLDKADGYLNMFKSANIERYPRWNTVRHKHCSVQYKRLVMVLCLCLNRMTYGVDVYESFKMRNAVPVPPNIGELYVELLLVDPPALDRLSRTHRVPLPLGHILSGPPQTCYAVGPPSDEVHEPPTKRPRVE